MVILFHRDYWPKTGGPFMEAFKLIASIIESNLLSFIGILGALALAQNASDARSAVTILLVGIALLIITTIKMAVAVWRGPSG